MNISIIGAGWVGLPLTMLLTANGHLVQVSKSSEDGLADLLLHGIDAKKVKLALGVVAKSDTANLAELGQADVVVITIPPGFRSGGGDYYPAHIKAICEHISPKVKQVILVSSTAVYPEIDKDMQESDASAWSTKAEKILAAEHVVRTLFPKQYVIARFGGLFGADRHPARFVKHMQSVSNRSYANMLHQDDAVHGLAYLISQQITAKVVNLSTPEKITKAEFYQAAVEHAATHSFEFNNSDAIVLPPVTPEGHAKYIKVDKIKAMGYQFRYNNPIDAL
ncbi:NAD(P)H-binding protein [Catenovulum sp. SX2]|uniref:NAD(P)H-binding protein n=1 Tax=Catenovulum sp. SX2 TaxID=3398614 RepID=UPI003F870983